MVLDNITNIQKYAWLCEDIDAVLALLKDAEIAPGQYPVSEKAFLIIQEYESREPKDIDFEAHRVHADIQIVLEGEEVQYYSKPEHLSIRVPFEGDNDICFFSLTSEESLHALHLMKGDITIYLPGECHAPCYCKEQKGKVKKAIVKVKYQ